MNCFPVFLSVHKMNTEFTFFTHVKAIHCSHEGHFVVQKEKERFAVIEISNLVKKYGDHTAVDHLSLVVEPGKIYGFLGPNGAGKSTTMNMITGYLGATSGEIKINGHDILKEPEKAKKCIGYLPELPPLYMDMTVKEYLCFVADLKQLEKSLRRRYVEEAMETTGTTELAGSAIRPGDTGSVGLVAIKRSWGIRRLIGTG